MRKPLLAALAVAGVLTLGSSGPTPNLPAPELTYYLPICGPTLPPDAFCIEAPDLAALRPPYVPPEIWRQIIAR